MASASSSSGFEPNAPRKYDVFISFSGRDIRYNFLGHLRKALKRVYFVHFRDEEQVEKGDEVTPSLIQAIKDSRVFVMVFSEYYASSEWCLDELHEIMQLTKGEAQFVIPIFYKVDPGDVQNQTGSAYKKAFENHEIDYQHDPDRVKRWRAALSKAGKLSGRHCQIFTDESNLVEQIVDDVWKKLERLRNCHGTLKDVFGIDQMVKPIEELLKTSHKVGIWGMGGAGKTTMAKVVFATLSSQYNHRCFLVNVREETERRGLKHVRDSLVLNLLGKDMQIDPSKEKFVVERLGRTKAFVVLDDVDTIEQLNNLQDNTCNCLEEGSKVIITTRDMQLLRANDYEIHEVKGLSYKNSRRLFVSKAFQSDHPKDGFEQLIEGFVLYTQHNPLALEILGSLVRSVHKKVWDDLLRKLRAGNPNDVIQKALRLSYDRLDYKEKQIFKDIACFLKGESEEFIEELMESYGFYPIAGMQTLKDKALIFTNNGKVEMHDLIQEMGHQIVREESIKEPGKRSRLWDSTEISDVLEKCQGDKEVEGIMLGANEKRGALKLTAKTFKEMTGLRFLKIRSYWEYDMSTSAIVLESFSTKIRYFHWKGYPMKSLPSNFYTEHLLELNLRSGKVETLWEGVQDLVNLRRLKLKWCRNLRGLPDFSKACRLESVDLSHCESLCYVDASLLSLHSLISLDVSGCTSLESLQSRIHLKSLKQINIDGCKKIKEFSVSSEELTSLDLSFTEIEELSPSIGRCSKLTTLHLLYTNLKNLPIKVLSCLTFLKELCIFLRHIDNVDLRVLFDRLHSLQSLSLQRCMNLTELPDNINQLSSLEKLYLVRWPHLTKLPLNMRLLSKLQVLSVASCTALHSLPELPPSLRKLNATYCPSLETVSPSTISSTLQNYGEKFFSFTNCVKLNLGAIEEQAQLLLEKAVHEKEDVEVYYPGKKVPEWFGNNRTQNDSDTLELCLSSHTLVGFVFCAVAPGFLDEKLSGYFRIAFSVKEDEMTEEVVEFPELKYITSGNVLLRSYPKASESILEKIEGERRNHDATTYNPNLSFKFSFDDGFSYHPAEECGVYPIYASGDSELNSNSRKGKAVII